MPTAELLIGFDLNDPYAGELPKEVIEPLTEVLSQGDPTTGTIFATWDGWGFSTPSMQRGAHVRIGSRGWYLLQAPSQPSWMLVTRR